VRHRLPEHATLVFLVEAPSRVWLGPFAGDDQHMAEALAVRPLQESPQRRMGIALPHAVEVEAGLNG